MRRCNTDRTISYTPEDFLVFKASPFASWMERLSVDNPDHGIQPDWDHSAKYHKPMEARSKGVVDNNTPYVESVVWDDFICRGSPAQPVARKRCYDSESLRRYEGGDVVVMDQSAGETPDGAQTLEAMHSGAQFVVNAQLVQAPLSCTVDMLIRSSGHSSFGDYSYLPCSIQAETTENLTLELSFSADLLQGIQGKLPAQMLVIPPGGQIVTLNTQDHIDHYQAVKKGFLELQLSFKKHRIPNPEDSSNFGRWSKCASAILEHRAAAKVVTDEEKITTMVAHAPRSKVKNKTQVYVDRDLPDEKDAALGRRLTAAGGAD